MPPPWRKPLPQRDTNQTEVITSIQRKSEYDRARATRVYARDDEDVLDATLRPDIPMIRVVSDFPHSIRCLILSQELESTEDVHGSKKIRCNNAVPILSPSQRPSKFSRGRCSSSSPASANPREVSVVRATIHPTKKRIALALRYPNRIHSREHPRTSLHVAWSLQEMGERTAVADYCVPLKPLHDRPSLSAKNDRSQTLRSGGRHAERGRCLCCIQGRLGCCARSVNQQLLFASFA